MVPRTTAALTRACALLTLSLYLTATQTAAQHPLIGTWKMISVKGIDADGKSFFLDTTSVRETKIITPTHYMLIAWDVENDSLIFNRTMAGQVRLEGKKYFEIPTQASVQIFENVTVDFSWKLEGDIFTQSGSIIRPDGKRVVLEALIFQRVTDAKSHPQNPAIGTWNQLSGYYTTGDGTNRSSFSESDTGLLIITPTHWMRMDHKNKKFGGVMCGTYGLDGDTVLTTLEYSTYPAGKEYNPKLTQEVDGKRIRLTSAGVTTDDKAAMFYHVFQKVE